MHTHLSFPAFSSGDFVFDPDLGEECDEGDLMPTANCRNCTLVEWYVFGRTADKLKDRQSQVLLFALLLARVPFLVLTTNTYASLLRVSR